nr:retrovirus-related Pol polyprotein from transposon TNT 1-94 [Tanacetum cinerariifolium]
MEETIHITFREDDEAISQSITEGSETQTLPQPLNVSMSTLFETEPKKLIKALEKEGWIIVMQEEPNQFERNKVWALVPKPHGKTIIGTKWIWKNKMDENGIVIKNKARLVAQGYNQ